MTKIAELTHANTRTLTLRRPIPRSTPVTELHIREPNAGELRGVSMNLLMAGMPEQTFTLLPRICEPVLTKSEMDHLSMADLMAINNTIAEFLIPND